MCLWDNSIWNGCVKLSLLRREYLSSVVNGLTNSIKILHSTKIDFFAFNYLPSDKGNGAVVQIATVFVAVYSVSCQRVLWKRNFQSFIYSPFSENVISEIHRLWGSSFFWKCWKFNVDFKNAEKNWEKTFGFWDISIWIGCIKLSLLKREYLSSAVNMLTNSFEILHSTKKAFCQLSYFRSDQYIW